MAWYYFPLKCARWTSTHSLLLVYKKINIIDSHGIAQINTLHLQVVKSQHPIRWHLIPSLLGLKNNSDHNRLSSCGSEYQYSKVIVGHRACRAKLLLISPTNKPLTAKMPVTLLISVLAGFATYTTISLEQRRLASGRVCVFIIQVESSNG